MHVSSLSRIDSFLRVIKKFLLRAFEICTAIPLYYSPLLGYDSLSLPLSFPLLLLVHCTTRPFDFANCFFCNLRYISNLCHISKHITSRDERYIKLITPSISFLVPSLYVLSLLLDETRTMHFKRARVENLYLSLSLDRRIVKLITSHA